MKKVLLSLFTLANVLFSCSLIPKGKDIIVPLSPIEGTATELGSTGMFMLTVDPDSIHSAFGKTIGLDTFIISQYLHHPEQYYYDRWQNKMLDQDGIRQKIDMLSMDTFLLRHSDSVDAESLILSGRNTAGDMIIIADTNNDNLLSNDSIIILKNWFNKNENARLDSFPRVIINNLRGFYKGREYIFSQSLTLKPITSREAAVEVKGIAANSLNLRAVYGNHSRGKFKYRGKSYQVAIRNTRGKLVYDKINTIIKFAPRNDDSAFQRQYMRNGINRPGDTLILGKRVFFLGEVSPLGQHIVLKPLSLRPEVLRRDILDDFTFTDLQKGTPIQLRPLLQQNAYTVIDFWGSWCAPCIAAFPDLKLLHDSLRLKNIGFLGVVYDDPSNKAKVQDLLNKHEISWHQFFIPRDEPYSMVNKYKVEAFPSFFIIDAAGHIVYRGMGEGALIEMKEFFRNLKLIAGKP